jgi:uncharacterized damage-inducible protein DinB
MTLAKIMLPEFDREMARTRRILSHLSGDLMKSKPHEKLHTIGWNANHIVDIVGWTPMIIANPEFDMAPIDGPAHETPNIQDVNELLAKFDENVMNARRALESTSDETMAELWSLKAGGQILFTISKEECLRTWVLNHIIHHRAILSVGLRILGVDVVPAYDE